MVRWASPTWEAVLLGYEPEGVTGMKRTGGPGRVLEGVMKHLLDALGDGEGEGELDVCLPALDTSHVLGLGPSQFFCPISLPPQSGGQVMSDEADRLLYHGLVDVEDTVPSFFDERTDFAPATKLPPPKAPHAASLSFPSQALSADEADDDPPHIGT